MCSAPFSILKRKIQSGLRILGGGRGNCNCMVQGGFERIDPKQQHMKIVLPDSENEKNRFLYPNRCQHKCSVFRINIKDTSRVSLRGFLIKTTHIFPLLSNHLEKLTLKNPRKCTLHAFSLLLLHASLHSVLQALYQR